jgi:hypothetical protein
MPGTFLLYDLYCLKKNPIQLRTMIEVSLILTHASRWVLLNAYGITKERSILPNAGFKTSASQPRSISNQCIDFLQLNEQQEHISSENKHVLSQLTEAFEQK